LSDPEGMVMSIILSPKAAVTLGKFGTREWARDFARVPAPRSI
jgi:hypothetical protein